MAITLDTRKGDNTIAIDVTLPNNTSTHTVILEFESAYDKQTTLRHLNVTQSGQWIVGVMFEESIPYSGNYTVSIHTSVEDFLALNEIVRSLDQISDPLNDLRGPSKDVLIDIVRAVILGSDWPMEIQPTEISRTITESAALSENLIENTEMLNDATETGAQDTSVVAIGAHTGALTQPDSISTTLTETEPLNKPISQPIEITTNTAETTATNNNPTEIQEIDTSLTETEVIEEELITYRQ